MNRLSKTNCLKTMVPSSEKNDSFIDFTLDTKGRVNCCNRALRAFFLIDRAEQLPITETVTPDDATKLVQLLDTASKGIPAKDVLQFITGNTTTAALLTIAPAYNGQTITNYQCLLRPDAEPMHLPKLEDKLKTFFEYDLECVKVLCPKGTLLDINPMGIRMMGAQSKESLLGESFIDKVFPEDRPLFSNMLQKTFEGGVLQEELRCYSKEGILHWVTAKSAPVRKGRNIHAMLLMLRDITAQKETECRLKKSQLQAEESARKMKAIAESMLDCVLTVNKEGYVDFCNNNTEQFTGLNRSHFINKPFTEVLQLLEAAEYAPYVEKALNEQVPVHFEGFYKCRHIWVEAKVFPFDGGVSVSFKDITEQKEARLKLELSEQKFKTLVQQGSDIIAIIDADNCFSYLSPNSYHYAGYHPEELVGKKLMDYIHPEDIPLVTEEIRKTKEGLNPSSETPHRFLHRKGHYIWLESKGSNLLYEKHIQGIVINARDITHHIELESQLAQELHTRQKEIAHAVIQAQERERSQMGQELHDDINQVLTTIKLYNEMIQHGIGDYAELASQSIYHLQKCIADIRCISKRLSAPTLGKISLADSVHELVQNVNLTKSLQVQFDAGSVQLPEVALDLHLAVYRIIQEQLNNILKHASAKHVCIKISNKGQGLLLTITDDGIGFNPQKQKPRTGITNMRTRAESFNGSFSITSKKGAGCTLEVFLPLPE